MDEQGRFRINNLLPGQVSLGLPNRVIDFNLRDAIDDVVIDLNAAEPPETALPTRRVVLRLIVPPGSPEPRGKLKVSRYHPLKKIMESDLLPIEGGAVSFDTPMPGKVSYAAGELVGYWLDEQWAQDVPEGEEPWVVQIPLKPAGAIYGRVIEADGTPGEGASISVIIVERPKDASHISELVQPQDVDLRSGQFVIAPVPMGGRYRLLARARESGNEAMAMSDEMVVSEEQPIHQTELQLPSGIPLDVHVVDPRGNPVPGIARLGYQSPFSYSSGGADRQLDHNGHIRFERVNPAMPGRYTIQVRPSRTYQGASHVVDFNALPVTIRLEPGLSAGGIVVDAATGQPVANIKLIAALAEPQASGYHGQFEATTDAEGRFQFAGLAAAAYRVTLDYQAPAVWEGNDINVDKDGLTSRTYRVPDPQVTGGQAGPVTLRIQLKPQ